jgi:hypothetical protein
MMFIKLPPMSDIINMPQQIMVPSSHIPRSSFIVYKTIGAPNASDIVVQVGLLNLLIYMAIYLDTHIQLYKKIP